MSKQKSEWLKSKARKKFRLVDGRRVCVDGFFLDFYEPFKKSGYHLLYKNGPLIDVVFLPFAFAEMLVKKGLLSWKKCLEHLQEIRQCQEGRDRQIAELKNQSKMEGTP